MYGEVGQERFDLGFDGEELPTDRMLWKRTNRTIQST
jgi:hypothetical protein